MLGVEHHLRDAGAGEGDAVGDHLEVLGKRATQGDLDVKVPGLAHHADHRGATAQDPHQPGIVLRAATRPARHAEGAQTGPKQRGRGGEEGVIGGIGAWPAALDIIDAQTVELMGNGNLVTDGEIDPLGLLAVAQGAVVEIDAIGAQGTLRQIGCPERH